MDINFERFGPPPCRQQPKYFTFAHFNTTEAGQVVWNSLYKTVPNNLNMVKIDLTFYEGTSKIEITVLLLIM